jgi:hypothetical protein
MNAHGNDGHAGARAFRLHTVASDAIAASSAMPGQYFATHLDSLAPQGLPAFIHRLVRRSSTPAVDECAWRRRPCRRARIRGPRGHIRCHRRDAGDARSIFRHPS